MTECDSFKNPLRAIGSHTTLSLRYGQCLTYAHSQITKDVGSHGRLSCTCKELSAAWYIRRRRAGHERPVHRRVRCGVNR